MKQYLLETYNHSMVDYLKKRIADGKHLFAFEGGRRSGKTFFISQFLIHRSHDYGDIVNVATMTDEQGRNGVFADM